MPVNSFEHYPMTWKPDRRKLVPPIYQSMAAQLEYDILNGFLAPHTKLPPQRELADYLDINLSTVTRALKLCEVKGLIYGITGSGTFVAPNVSNAIFLEDSDQKNVIEMGLVEPLDYLSSSYVAEVIQNIAEKNYLEKLLDYRNPLGMPYHKMAAKKWMARFNLEVPIENIIITSGGQNSLTLILMALFHAGDKIAVDTYTYPNFIELANMLNINLVPIDGDFFGMVPERLEEACRKNQLDGIYLIPSCHNPTAVTMDMNRRKEIAKIIRKYNLTLLEDDIFSFLAPEGLLPISHFVPDQFVYSLSVSKSLSSGIRVGFLAVANQFIDKITHGIFNINVKTSALNAEVITELINTGYAEKIISQKKNISKERNLLYQKYFQINNSSENPLTFFRWVPLDKKHQMEEFEQNAFAQGIRIYHSDRFLAKKDETNQFTRISLSSAKTHEELDKGLKTLKNSLH
ncbi:PLP-dependent aminotransferase family protein [Bacillus velezensis]|uniref:aminotransferase-like domain-containing protein n=1 Tax=Bacillus velezensis TaxID=492670 RepID=UPI0023DFB4E5|nr:PLP-dependent aminotransferase family protein [Bacillus velezensis]MDF3257407.1 PLP-dependent aminotransferase family protein [Bacillus velezensis]MDF3269741.1 PLP-dependent aminotransferase family protein [Bacillus velezensis]